MTVYLFDADKRVRKIIPPNGLTQLIHDEAAHLLYATVSMDCKVVNGEYLGFRCIDGKFRLFTVTNSENKDDNRTTIITATDAIVQELREIIVEDYQPLDVTLMDAIHGLLEAAGEQDAWTVTGAQPERTEKSRAYFATLWAMLESYMTLYKWQIIPYYTFFGGSISGRVIEMKEDKAEFRGRILTSKKDASNVYVIKNNPPYTRLYGIGPATGSGDLQTNMTFADVSWSIASGNPADKPKGQAWVEDREAVAKYGLHTAVVQINEAEDAEQLIEKTWEELQRLKEPSCTVEATVQDLEQVPGYKNQVIRLGDLVPIRLSNATMETARVIGIKRDYLQHWLTKIVIGDKEATIQSQVSSLIAGAAHTFERLTIYKNRFREDEALIQLNAEFVQANAEAIELNAKEIRANAELITLKAEKSEVTEMGTRISEAEILIDALDARIDLIATESSVSELAERVSRAEIRIDGAEQTVDIFAGTLDEFGNRLDGAEVLVNGMESKINLKADKTTVDGLDERLNQAEIDINGAEAAIDLWAGEIDEFGNRLDGAEVLINGMESRINLKADKTTVVGLDERLNQAEIDINGAEAAIDLWAGEIDEFGNRLDGAEILINGMESRINLKADKTTVDGLDKRLNQAEIDINGAEAAIDLWAGEIDEFGNRLDGAEILINGMESRISLKADKTTVDGLDERLNQAEIDINGAEAAITLKANQSTVDGLATQTAELLVKYDQISTKVEDNEGNISTLTQTVNGFSAKIEDVEGNVSTIDNTVNGLSQRVENAEGQVAEFETTINGLRNTVTNNTGDISTLTNTISGLNSTVTSHTGSISTLTNTIGGLTSRVTNTEGDISTLTNTVGGLNSRVEDAEGDISTLENTVDGLESTVQNTAGNISALSNTVTGLSSTVSDHTGNISTLTNTVNGLNSTVSNNAGRISTLTNTIGGLTSRVEDAEGNISTLQTTSSGFETRVTNAEGRVAALSVTVSEQGSRIDAQAETINLKADQSTVNALTSRVSTAEADISAAEAAIKLKASTAVTDALSYGLSDVEAAIKEAEILIDGANAAIALKASQSDVDALGDRVSQAEIKVDGVGETIDLWAGEMDEFGNRLDGAEVLINGMESRISLKADKTTVDGLDKRVAQAEVDIDGAEAAIALKANLETVENLTRRVTQAEIDINGAEETIDLWAGEIDEFGERLDGAEIKIDGLEKDITAAVNDVEGKVAAMELSLTDLESSAMLKTVYEENRTADLQLISNAEKSIATLRTQHGNQIAGLEYFLIDLESSALMKTVYEENRTADLQLISNATESVERLETKYDGQIASLELKATEQDSLISAKADLILLNGYVKASELETEVLFILDNAWAEDLSVNTFVANSVNTFFLSADDIRTDALLVEGYNFTTHSHAVTVNSDGTITLGEVSSTGGSFKIADTQFYKDGVSAARNSVTLTSMGWQGGRNVVEASNGKSLTVDLPSFSTSGGDTWNAYNQTTVFFYTGSVNGPLASKTVDASSVYKAGYDLGLSEGSGGGAESVTLTSSGWVNGSNVISASNGMSLRIDLPTFSASGGTTWTNNKTTVHFSTPSVNGPLLSKEVDASSVYTSGYNVGSNGVTISAAGWVGGSNVVSASNGKSVTVSLPSFTTSGGTTWDSNNRTTVYFYTGSVNGPLASRVVDASSIYEKGLVDGAGSGEVEITLSASGWDGMLNTITASNGASLTVDATPIYELGKGSVTLSVSGWQYGGVNTVTASNGESERITLPPFTSSGGTSFDANHQTTVFFYTGSVTGPLATRTVDASSVYKAGYDLGLSEGGGNGGGADSVTLSSSGWVGGINTVSASNGKSITIDLPPFKTTGGDTFTSNKTTVYFYSEAANGILARKEVDASSVYSSGQSSVTLSAAGWSGGSNVVSASNGKSVTVTLPTFTTSGGTTFSNNKTTVYFYTSSVNGPLASREVDASSVYDAGYAAGVASVDTAAAYDEGYAAGYEAAKAAVKVTAGISQSGFPAQYYARYYYWATATIDGEEVGSASGYQSFNVSGAM